MDIRPRAPQIAQLLLQKASYTLNWKAEESMTLLLGMATRFCEIAEAQIDTVGPKLRYKTVLTGLFPEISEIIVEEKAAGSFVNVAAASVIAKHMRDTTQARLTYHFGREEPAVQQVCLQQRSSVGPGYPGDDDTVAWLDTVEQTFTMYPTTVRRSWSTTQKRRARRLLADSEGCFQHL